MAIAIPFDEGGQSVLIPTAAPDGSTLSDEAAVEQYKSTGKHYGKFDTSANAQAYADQLAAPAPPPGPADTTVPAPAATPATAPGGAPSTVTPAAAAPGAPPTIQPIPTGQPPVPGTAPPPAAPPPNRTGLPMPDELARRIWADPSLRNDAERAQAFAHAESIYRTSEAALAQQERIRTQAAQQQLRDAENEVYADVYSATPKITPQQIAVDPRYNSDPGRRKAMIELVNDPPGTGIPGAQSHLAAQSVIDRIRLPDGDPNKIVSRNQIYDQMHSLNRADFDFVLKKYEDLTALADAPLLHKLEQFLHDMRPQIDKAGALPGLPVDGRGSARAFEYRQFVEGKIAEYRDHKPQPKNPYDLFDKSKPDYVGSDATMAHYRRTLNEALADLKADYGTMPGAEPGAAPGTAPDPDAAAKAALRAARENKLITPEQAAAVAVQRGWARPPNAPAIAPPVR